MTMICECGDLMEQHVLDGGERTYCAACECADFSPTTEVVLDEDDDAR